MLRVSKMADYATVIMVHLARHAQVHTAKQIANDIHLSIPTVSKLLKLLANAELLDSQLGAKGGYHLTRDAKDISVASIIQAIEGNTGLTECSHHEGDCAIETVCSIRSNWRVISAAVHNALDSVSLAELAGQMSVTSVNIKNIPTIQRSEQ